MAGRSWAPIPTARKPNQSRRSIRVTQHVIDLLKSYKADQAARRLLLGDAWAAEWTEHPRLFTNQDGRPMSPSTPLNRLRRYLDKLGLPPVSLHSLRHTNATLLIQQGVSVRAVSGRLGHSQTSTTMNIYAHQLQSCRRGGGGGSRPCVEWGRGEQEASLILVFIWCLSSRMAEAHGGASGRDGQRANA